MKINIAMLMALVVLVGCAKDPIATSSTNNAQIQVSMLFQHDRCTIYRFEDEWYLHYYAVCGDKQASVESYIQSGKTKFVENTPTTMR